MLNKIKDRLFYVTIFILISNFMYSQRTGFDKYLMVRASKLSIREKPDINSEKLGVIEKGKIVKLISQRTERKYIDVIDGIKDSWVEIEYNGIEGFMFGGYLSYSQIYSPNSNWTGKYILLGEENGVFSNELLWFGTYSEEDAEYIEQVNINFEFNEIEGGIAVNPKIEGERKYRWLIGSREKLNNGKIGINNGAFTYNGNLELDKLRLPIPFYKQNGLLNTDLYLGVKVSSTDKETSYNCYDGEYELGLYDNGNFGTRVYTFNNLLVPRLSCPSLLWFGDLNRDEIPDFIFHITSSQSYLFKFYVSKIINGKVEYDISY